MGGHGGEGRGEGGESGGVGVRVSAYNPLPGQSEPHRSSNVAKKKTKKKPKKQSTSSLCRLLFFLWPLFYNLIL